MLPALGSQIGTRYSLHVRLTKCIQVYRAEINERRWTFNDVMMRTSGRGEYSPVVLSGLDDEMHARRAFTRGQ
jgi:hypothetical protein